MHRPSLLDSVASVFEYALREREIDVFPCTFGPFICGWHSRMLDRRKLDAGWRGRTSRVCAYVNANATSSPIYRNHSAQGRSLTVVVSRMIGMDYWTRIGPQAVEVGATGTTVS